MVDYMRKAMQALPLAALVWVVLERPAFANGIESTLGCYGIIAFVFILVPEAIVVNSIVKAGQSKVVEAVLWINLGSLVCGFAFAMLYLTIAWGLFAIALLGLLAMFVKRKNNTIPLVELLMFNLLLLFAILTRTSLQAHVQTERLPFPKPHQGLDEFWIITITWILYFLLTLVIESLYARRFIRHPRLDWAILAANIVSYGILALIFII